MNLTRLTEIITTCKQRVGGDVKQLPVSQVELELAVIALSKLVDNAISNQSVVQQPPATTEQVPTFGIKEGGVLGQGRTNVSCIVHDYITRMDVNTMQSVTFCRKCQEEKK